MLIADVPYWEFGRETLIIFDSFYEKNGASISSGILDDISFDISRSFSHLGGITECLYPPCRTNIR